MALTACCAADVPHKQLVTRLVDGELWPTAEMGTL